MNLYEIKHENSKRSAELKNKTWARFRKYHYSPADWSVGARVFVATEIFDGKELIVGLTAAIFAPAQKAWYPHKIVALPPRSNTVVWGTNERAILPDYNPAQMWHAVADADAAQFIAAGHLYFSNASSAPLELKVLEYRNNPASGWVPTSKNDAPPKDKGHNSKKFGTKPRATNADGLVVSHWYVGFPEAASSVAVTKIIHRQKGSISFGRRCTYCDLSEGANRKHPTFRCGAKAKVTLPCMSRGH